MPINHGKYDQGKGVSFIDAPKAVNGMAMPIAIMVNVVIMTGQEARLCINGILRVRIM